MSQLIQLLTGITPYPIQPGIAITHICEDDADPERPVKTHCPHCGRTDLTAEDFYMRSTGYLSSWCKPCSNSARRERKAKEVQK